MYEIIGNPKMMSKADIDKIFMGKWIYIVNDNIDMHGTLIEGMPVVLGEYQFDGVEEGIYAQFDGTEYGSDLSYNLLPHGDIISSVFGVGLPT